MSIIISRGKVIDKKSRQVTDKWAYGIHYKLWDRDIMAYSDAIQEIKDNRPICTHAVVSASVGLCSGAKDCHDTDMYEDDLVYYKDGYTSEHYGIVRFGRYHNASQLYAYDIGFWIEWLGDMDSKLLRKELGFWSKSDDIPEKECYPVEIIGNTYDMLNGGRNLTDEENKLYREALRRGAISTGRKLFE